MTAAVCVFALLVIVFTSLSARFSRSYLTGPIIFLLAGGGLALLSLVEPEGEGAAIRTLCEVTLVLVLFHDAAELQPRELRSDAGFTARLLLVGLPLTIGAGFLLARVLFPGIGVWLALLLAAGLAPTDAGLGAATVLNPVVPARVRRILNVESGLNDGLATPVVLFAAAAATGFADGSTEHGLVSGVLEIAVGALVGAVVGFLAGRLVERARDHGWAERALLPLAAVAVPVLCYYGAHGLGGNGFIAAFVAGTAYAAGQKDIAEAHDTVGFTGLTSAFLGFGVWMVFGAVAAAYLGPLVTWRNVAYAVLSLTVVRMVPVALSLIGTGLRPRTVVFIGWFGPRGLASIIFALIAYESLDAEPAVATVLSVIATTVILSVVAHGLTASPWAQRYGSLVRGERPDIESAEAVEPLRHRRHAAPPGERR